MELARLAFDQILEDAKLTEKDVDYVATTGEGESYPLPHRALLFDDDSRTRRHLP